MTAYVVKRPTGVGVLSRGRDYSVKDLGGSQGGYTNLLRKELGVSLLADAPQTRWTQIHELSHVRHSLWSPERIVRYIAKTHGRKVSVGCVLAAEDARINEIAHRRVPDAHVGFALADPTGMGLRQDLEGYVASHASPAVLADVIRPACDPAKVAVVDAWLARLSGMSERELSVLRVTVPLALVLDDAKAGRGSKAKGEGKGKGKSEPKRDAEDEDESDDGATGEDDGDAEGEDEDEGGGDAEDEDDADTGADEGEDGPGDGDADSGEDESDAPGDDAEDGKGDTGAGEGADEDADPEDAEALGEPDAAGGGGHVCGSPLPGAGASKRDVLKWVIPTVVEPPLTIPLRGGNAMVTTAETGTSLRWASLHRIATDGVVFRKVRRRPGALQRGTVLIDVSGSMSFTAADLEAIVAAMPYATVAVYSGYHTAMLIVVARNGKRAPLNERMFLGGNVCDGPALLWLSRQAAPRLWVCDGVVTGKSDVAHSDLSAQCGAIMESAGILQVVSRDRGLTAVCSRKLVRGRAPAVAELLAAVRDLERGRAKV